MRRIEEIIMREIRKRKCGQEPLSVYITGEDLPTRLENDMFEAIRHPHDENGALYIVQVNQYARRNTSTTY